MLNKIKTWFLRLSDNTKSYFVIWWFAGAVYFFVGWGTNLGQLEDPFALIFFLGLGMGLVTAFLINPIIYHMFTIQRRGKIANKKYFQRSVLQGALFKLLDFLKAFVINILIFITYQLLNQALILLLELNPDRVVVPGEPILYATFYTFYYSIFVGIANTVAKALSKKEVKPNE